jgi:hypothetical protein
MIERSFLSIPILMECPLRLRNYKSVRGCLREHFRY